MSPWARCASETYHIMGGNGWRLILCLLSGIAHAHHPHGPEWVGGRFLFHKLSILLQIKFENNTDGMPLTNIKIKHTESKMPTGYVSNAYSD